MRSLNVALTLTVLLNMTLMTEQAVSTGSEPLEINVPSDVTTINEAIVMAQDGDTILVSPGTYVGQVNPMGKAIEIRSIAGPDLTVLRGDGDEVIRIISGEGPDTRIEGFNRHRRL